MLPINPSSFFTPIKSLNCTLAPTLSYPRLTTNFRCRAVADLPVGPSFPRWWFNFLAAADAAVPGVGRSSDSSSSRTGTAGAGAPFERGSASNSSNKNTKVNAKEKRWSRNRESYLADDDDALPLPMTYPDPLPLRRKKLTAASDVTPKFRIVRLLCMNGLENVEVVKELVTLATTTREAGRPFANAYPALELDMFKR